ncbi:hypothetical protein GCM10023319_20050 [Nocardia iowensis]
MSALLVIGDFPFMGGIGVGAGLACSCTTSRGPGAPLHMVRGHFKSCGPQEPLLGNPARSPKGVGPTCAIRERAEQRAAAATELTLFDIAA